MTDITTEWTEVHDLIAGFVSQEVDGPSGIPTEGMREQADRLISHLRLFGYCICALAVDNDDEE